MVAFTGHGYINYPAKESCIAVPSRSDENPDIVELRFINIEDLARKCAAQKNTITIIIDNSCRVFPEQTYMGIKKFTKKILHFEEDTNGEKSQK